MSPPQHSLRDNAGSADPFGWARARDIFHTALELPPHRRAAFLQSACGDNHELRDEVSSLLASDQQAGDFIERPAAALLSIREAPDFAPRLSAGTTFGRYEIQEFLGAGGISEVYRARDTRLGRAVALKFVTDARDPEASSRLLAEAQHASILNHPNICGVHEAEDGGGRPFIVLELVEGPTLHEVLSTRRPSIAETLQWGREIASALDHAHRRGVIHRDLKSANVAFTSDGSVKILDFGLSRRIVTGASSAQPPETILANASLAGTLTHIAPEVLRGEPVDARVDLWAFGVMLYEMTAGVLPFRAPTTFETADAILNRSPEPLPTSVPIGLRRLIQRCLAKDPGTRVASAADLRLALDALQVADRRALPTRRSATRIAVAVTGMTLIALAALYGGWGRQGLHRATPTLAVLPLDNTTGAPEQAFFADGITEALIAALGRLDGIRVIAASTSMRYRGGATRTRDIARAVGATHLLEGSLARTGGEVRLSARLTDAANGRVLWSDEYVREARELQALHATVAGAIAAAAKIDLNVEDAKQLAAVRAVDPDVYEAYLKGRYYWNRRTGESIRMAIGFFERAIALDPTYAPAYAALADSYNQLGTVLLGGGPPAEWRPRAAEAAIKALQIDGNLAEAHATLGYVRHYDWQWDEAESAFLRAIALNPSNALARIWYANFLSSQRRFDEAIREVLIGRDLDPLSLIVSTNVGWVYYRARRNEEAIAEYKRGLALDPDYVQAHIRLADAYASAGRWDDAITEAETVVRLSNGNLANRLLLEQTKLLARRPNEFERRLTELIAQIPHQYFSPGTIANAYFAVGRNEEGFVWLERAYQARTNNVAYLAVEPVYDRVRDDSRFVALTRAVGLP
jgi:TolB-like protein/Tfp pilus assembly protein PilF